MVGERRDALPARGSRELLDALARAAIDNPALAFVACDHRFDLPRGIGLAPHGEMDVRPVEGSDENARTGGKQLADDVRAGWRVGGGRHRDELKIADRLRRLREAEIFGPEIGPPLRDAMGLVNGENVGSRLAKKGGRIRTREALRRDVEEAITAALQARLDCRIVFAAVRRVQRGGGNSTGLQLLHLIAHQRDQRRDDDGEPRAHDRGQLIAKRFARSRRHDRENIFPREHRFENFLLAWPEAGKAENAFQRLFRLVHLRVHGVPASKVLAITSYPIAAKLSSKHSGVARPPADRAAHEAAFAISDWMSFFNLAARASGSASRGVSMVRSPRMRPGAADKTMIRSAIKNASSTS